MVGNFGQKGYQVFTTAASSSDYYARMGSYRSVDAADPRVSLPWTGQVPWPQRRLQPGRAPRWSTDNRFKISSGQRRRTPTARTSTPPAYLYSEDGRYAPGPWDDHLSGDAWVADAGMRFMAEMPNWSAIHLNFSGIDKIGHMWGGGAVDNVAWDPTDLLTEVHMAFQAKNADDQLGYIKAELERLGQLDETLIVLLADHGSTYAQNAYYVDKLQAAATTAGTTTRTTRALTRTTVPCIGLNLNNESVLAPLNANGNLAYSYQSTAIEAWLIDQSWGKKVATARR